MNKFELENNVKGTGIVALIPVVYFFTNNSQVIKFAFGALILSLIFLLSFYIFKRSSAIAISYFASLTVLLLVGVTGWFNSPVFYFIYILAISLAFVYSPIITFGFSVILALLFVPYIPRSDILLNSLTFLSLLYITPLSYHLRSLYLSFREGEKKILILEKEGIDTDNKVQKVLANKVSRLGVELREAVADIKHITFQARKYATDLKVKNNLNKVLRLAEITLDKIKRFEEKVTGKKLAENKV